MAEPLEKRCWSPLITAYSSDAPASIEKKSLEQGIPLRWLDKCGREEI